LPAIRGPTNLNPDFAAIARRRPARTGCGWKSPKDLRGRACGTLSGTRAPPLVDVGDRPARTVPSRPKITGEQIGGISRWSMGKMVLDGGVGKMVQLGPLEPPQCAAPVTPARKTPCKPAYGISGPCP